jgi:hypothetical protein
MLRKSVVLLLLALSLSLAVPGMSIAQGQKANASTNGVINVFPDCGHVPTNLVGNCGFETGDFSNWEQSGDTSYTDVSPVAAHSGNFGGRFGPTMDLGFIAQTLSTIPGQVYNLSFWLVSSGQPNRFQVYWDGNLLSDCVNFPDTRTPSAIPGIPPPFGQYGFSNLPAGSGATELKFGFFNPPSFFFLDDIAVVPVSEGASSN